MPPLPYPSWVYFAFFLICFFVWFCFVLFVCLFVCFCTDCRPCCFFQNGAGTHFLGTPTDFRHAFLHTCLMYWLSFKTDHDRLLTTLANSVVSKETLCDIWLTINLRGKKKSLRLSSLPGNANEKDYFPASNFNRIKIPCRKSKESCFFYMQLTIFLQLPASRTL